MKVYVIKANGQKQLFDKEKVVRSSMRMGVSRKNAEMIAQNIEKKIYNGIDTKKIFQMVLKQIHKCKPKTKHQICLRRALALIKPMPDFEHFIQIILSENGYDVTPNRIIKGKCSEHEVDAIVVKNGVRYIVEVKHHFNYHTPTGLDVGRIAFAVLEDISEGHSLGLNDLKIDKAMIVCNTKLSSHAKNYTRCKGIDHIGWNSPRERDLQMMIEEKKLYPLTYLNGLKTSDIEKFSSVGIILLKEIIENNLSILRKKTGLRKDQLSLMVEKTEKILSNN